MDTKELIKLLREQTQQFAGALDQHQDGSIAIAKLEQLFREYLELQEQVFGDTEPSDK